MNNKDLYRAIVIGPTGVGKSQFCNFIQRDLTNSINNVSDSLNSCTQDPFSNIFTRCGKTFEFIDTAGSNDSSNNDIKNLEKLIEYLKIKKEIDYIILVLKFTERLTADTREYIETLGKIFTSNELYKHLCVIFTKYPLNPTQKELNKKIKYIDNINRILRELFNIKTNNDNNEENMPNNIKTYFIDTEIDEEENKFIEKYQNTIDIMLEQMIVDAGKYKSINTSNLDIKGDNAKLRRENELKEIETLKKKIEEEKLENEKREKERIRLQQEYERERLRIKEENERREREYREQLRREEEERIRLENERRRLEYQRRRDQEEYERRLEEQRRIEAYRRRLAEEEEKNRSICFIF